jgi:6-pyruvoyltetrahydropterin/6-carboxytetrahydropterin synthase
LYESYSVRIAKEDLVFSAGHFITFGDVCERLHGHNFRVTAEVHAKLDENHYVVDFVLLRKLLGEIVSELDHHMLLPTEHPTIRVVADERSVEVTYQDRRWVFPREDCVLLSVPNTTAEMLARWIARRLQQGIVERAGVHPRRTIVAVDECAGQWGVCELTDD